MVTGQNHNFYCIKQNDFPSQKPNGLKTQGIYRRVRNRVKKRLRKGLIIGLIIGLRIGLWVRILINIGTAILLV